MPQLEETQAYNATYKLRSDLEKGEFKLIIEYYSPPGTPLDIHERNHWQKVAEPAINWLTEVGMQGVPIVVKIHRGEELEDVDEIVIRVEQTEPGRRRSSKLRRPG